MPWRPLPRSASSIEVAHFLVERAHRAGHLHRPRDDVERLARLHHRHRQHRRAHRVDVARHDRLQRDVITCAAIITGSTVFCGIARMAALALDVDRELVARRHEAAGADAETAGRHARHVVHAVDLLDAEALHQPVLDHRLAAGAAFFGRLEDHAPRCRRNCASRPDTSRRPAASRCVRHARRHASCPGTGWHRACRSARRSAAHPCRRAGRWSCPARAP